MKKYQRLLLVIISIISLSLFLIYRHHYNRLHHVLEVFNFFGTPCNFSELQHTQDDLPEHDWGPQPLWQQLDTKSYIYSAFLVEKNTVQGIGVRHSSVTIPKSCILYFDDENKSSKCKLSVLNVGEDRSTGFHIYKYNCTFLNNKKVPYSIAFKRPGERRYVYSLITNNLSREVALNVTACVVPGNFTKKSLLEFLSFQNLLGVDSFIIYFEANIPHSLIKLLKNLSRTLNMCFTFLPYSLPYSLPSNLTTSVIEYDCQMRTRGHSKYSIALSINEYVVPSHDSNFDTKLETIRLPIKRFCLNHVNKNRPMILQNFELIDDYSFNVVKTVNRNKFKENTDIVRRIPNVFESKSVVHRYVKCDKGVKTKTDTSVKRFSTDFTRSTLVQLLIHEDNM